MNKRAIAVVCLVVGVALGTLSGRTEVAGAEGTAYVFEAGTGLEAEDYKKVHLEIVDNIEGTYKISAQELRTKVELAMRSAGLVPTDTRQEGAGTLRVVVWGGIVLDGREMQGLLDVQYIRTVYYAVNGKGYAKDVSVQWGGIGGGINIDYEMSREAIFDTLTNVWLDPFLNQYLKANQDAGK